jgi:hypothetical protein
LPKRKSSTDVRLVLGQEKGNERTRLKSDGPLAELQQALKAAQDETKHERRARIKAERALIEAQEKLTNTPPEVERNPHSQTRRISFVVRLTLDGQGQFERTEIEHVTSGKKQNFLSLDGDLLVAFMKACLNPETIPEDTISTKSR